MYEKFYVISPMYFVRRKVNIEHIDNKDITFCQIKYSVLNDDRFTILLQNTSKINRSTFETLELFVHR